MNEKKTLKRGSEKLLAAWKTRTLTEDSVREIGDSFDKSPAKIHAAKVLGGSNATSVQLSLSYTGDDIAYCGNDIMFWLKWHLKHGGRPREPRIIINGTPVIDFLRVHLSFGNADEPLPTDLDAERGSFDPSIGGVVVIDG